MLVQHDNNNPVRWLHDPKVIAGLVCAEQKVQPDGLTGMIYLVMFHLPDESATSFSAMSNDSPSTKANDKFTQPVKEAQEAIKLKQWELFNNMLK